VFLDVVGCWDVQQKSSKSHLSTKAKKTAIGVTLPLVEFNPSIHSVLTSFVHGLK